MLGPGVASQNSLRLAVGQTPFKHLRRARSRSACVLRHTHPPQALRFSAQPEGVGAGSRTAAALAAAPGVGDARGARCRRDWCDRSDQAKRSEAVWAERSNGPYGARSHPLLTVPRSAGPGVSACRRTRASLSGLPQLFERSSKNAASSAAHPRTEHHRLPHSPNGRVGTRAAGSSFLGLPSFDEAKEGRCAAGRTPGPPTPAKACGNPRYQSISPSRVESDSGTDRPRQTPAPHTTAEPPH